MNQSTRLVSRIANHNSTKPSWCERYQSMNLLWFVPPISPNGTVGACVFERLPSLLQLQKRCLRTVFILPSQSASRPFICSCFCGQFADRTRPILTRSTSILSNPLPTIHSRDHNRAKRLTRVWLQVVRNRSTRKIFTPVNSTQGQRRLIAAHLSARATNPKPQGCSSMGHSSRDSS